MLKRFLSVVLALCLMIGIAPLSIGAENEEFVIENGVLIRYNGPGGDVVIPNGVVAIGERVFSQRSNVKNVTFPDSIREIGDDSFYRCYDLESVALPPIMPDGRLGVQAFFL